jgi:hypothetical protein
MAMFEIALQVRSNSEVAAADCVGALMNVLQSAAHPVKHQYTEPNGPFFLIRLVFQAESMADADGQVPLITGTLGSDLVRVVHLKPFVGLS